MEITWYGLSCFRITERNFATVITDPYNNTIGLTLPKLKGDIVSQSHDSAGHNNIGAINGAQLTLTGPGEYELGNVFVNATASRGQTPRNIFFLFDFDGLTVAHAGDIAKMPSQAQVEAMGEVNVLLLPVGGGSSLAGAQAAELVSLIEPNIVIPMHFKTDGMKLDLEGADRFLQEVGSADLEPQTSLKVSSSSLPEETQTVLLTPKL